MQEERKRNYLCTVYLENSNPFMWTLEIPRYICVPHKYMFFILLCESSNPDFWDLCSSRVGLFITYHQFSSVAQSCLTPCDPMDCSTPSLPVHHPLPENTQTHVHWIGDAIQPPHPLSQHLLLPSIFPSIRVFSNESVLHLRWPNLLGVLASASVLPMNIQDWFPLGWTGWISLQSKGWDNF